MNKFNDEATRVLLRSGGSLDDFDTSKIFTFVVQQYHCIALLSSTILPYTSVYEFSDVMLEVMQAASMCARVLF